MVPVSVYQRTYSWTKTKLARLWKTSSSSPQIGSSGRP